jgi:predicted AlkP superfamily phosphohydrolase/phosphomutase
MVMMTGKNPGKLGIYGFRHRKGHNYRDGYIVSSMSVKEPAVWDVIGRAGMSSCIIGLPPSYPPKPLNGNLVTCMITPGLDKQYTFPAELKQEVEKVVGRYVFDVTFRIEDREAVKNQLFEMTNKRFELAKHLMETKKWNLFILHEIGFDRLHHAFWKFFDPAHPKYVKGNQYEGIAEEYYRLVDAKIGELLEVAGKDTLVFVVSDHGSKAMKGAFCINQWLEQEGFLKLKSRPKGVTDIEKADIDWEKTKAWGWGGYYARIFLNVKGREPQGSIEPSDVPGVIRSLKEGIMRIQDPSGRTMKNVVLDPDELYGLATGDKPDLMVYFDDLDWRSAGTLGHDSLYLSENDTGPDDSVHSMNGIFIFHDPGEKKGRGLSGLKSIDMAPTLLKLLEVPVPGDMQGGPMDLRPPGRGGT